MAERAEHIGVEKTRLEVSKLVALAILAGAFIGFGSMFSVIVTAGGENAMPYGVSRLLGVVVFSLGLILVIVGGAERFTGNNLMIMACASGKVKTREILRAILVGHQYLILGHNRQYAGWSSGWSHVLVHIFEKAIRVCEATKRLLITAQNGSR